MSATTIAVATVTETADPLPVFAISRPHCGRHARLVLIVQYGLGQFKEKGGETKERPELVSKYRYWAVMTKSIPLPTIRTRFRVLLTVPGLGRVSRRLNVTA